MSVKHTKGISLPITFTVQLHLRFSMDRSISTKIIDIDRKIKILRIIVMISLKYEKGFVFVLSLAHIGYKIVEY